MLDLATLGLAMGLQGDMEKMREESGVEAVSPQEQEAAPPAPVAAVANVLDAIESTACSAMQALIPDASLVDSIASLVQAPTVDLSLPTAAKKS